MGMLIYSQRGDYENEKTSRIETVEELRTLILSPNGGFDTLLSLDVECISTVVQLLDTEGRTATAFSTQTPYELEDYCKRCMKALRAVVKKYQILPASLMRTVTREGDHAIGGGGFADIWKGRCDDRVVCLKVLRFHVQASERMRERAIAAFCQEAMVWQHLDHPNVLPCLGVNMELFHPACCLISPWMGNGDITSFLRINPGLDRGIFIAQIARGLEYLHSLRPVVIHGDIKGANILVDELRNCRLADFGLAAVSETEVIRNVTSSAVRGSVRWMAPELFDMPNAPASGNDKRPRDVYAFGCTMYEIVTGHPSFPDFNDFRVMLEVLNGTRPSRPSNDQCSDLIWNLTERCWASNPLHRPRATHILWELREFLPPLYQPYASRHSLPRLSV